MQLNDGCFLLVLAFTLLQVEEKKVKPVDGQVFIMKVRVSYN